jgi:hypothetical protein
MFRITWVLALAVSAQVACSNEDGSRGEVRSLTTLPRGVWLNERIYLQRPEQALAFAGGGCFGTSSQPLSPAEGAGGKGWDMVVSMHDRAQGGATVSVESNGDRLESREYSVDFLRSGAIDTFRVTTTQGYKYQLFYWGGACSRDLSPPAVSDGSR